MCCWVLGHIEVCNLPAVMAEHDKHIQNAKCSGRDGEEINPSQTVGMESPRENRSSISVSRDGLVVFRGLRQTFTGRAIYSIGFPKKYTNYSISQFSTLNPGTRENSPVLAVTTIRPELRACAAISMSFGPMGVPLRAR